MTYQELATYRQMIVKGSASLSDEDALEVPMLYDAWTVGKLYEVKDGVKPRITYNDKLYRVEQTHTSQADWTPDITPALYSVVAEGGQGDDPSNPIPYDGNMELFEGKYYSQSDVVYYCFRSTGQPVYHPLAELVGYYVEVWNNGE